MPRSLSDRGILALYILGAVYDPDRGKIYGLRTSCSPETTVLASLFGVCSLSALSMPVPLSFGGNAAHEPIGDNQSRNGTSPRRGREGGSTGPGLTGVCLGSRANLL